MDICSLERCGLTDCSPLAQIPEHLYPPEMRETEGLRLVRPGSTRAPPSAHENRLGQVILTSSEAAEATARRTASGRSDHDRSGDDSAAATAAAANAELRASLPPRSRSVELPALSGSGLGYLVATLPPDLTPQQQFHYAAPARNASAAGHRRENMHSSHGLDRHHPEDHHQHGEGPLDGDGRNVGTPGPFGDAADVLGELQGERSRSRLLSAGGAAHRPPPAAALRHWSGGRAAVPSSPSTRTRSARSPPRLPESKEPRAVSGRRD